MVGHLSALCGSRLFELYPCDKSQELALIDRPWGNVVAINVVHSHAWNQSVFVAVVVQGCDIFLYHGLTSTSCRSTLLCATADIFFDERFNCEVVHGPGLAVYRGDCVDIYHLGGRATFLRPSKLPLLPLSRIEIQNINSGRRSPVVGVHLMQGAFHEWLEWCPELPLNDGSLFCAQSPWREASIGGLTALRPIHLLAHSMLGNNCTGICFGGEFDDAFVAQYPPVLSHISKEGVCIATAVMPVVQSIDFLENIVGSGSQRIVLVQSGNIVLLVDAGTLHVLRELLNVGAFCLCNMLNPMKIQLLAWSSHTVACCDMRYIAGGRVTRQKSSLSSISSVESVAHDWKSIDIPWGRHVDKLQATVIDIASVELQPDLSSTPILFGEPEHLNDENCPLLEGIGKRSREKEVEDPSRGPKAIRSDTTLPSDGTKLMQSSVGNTAQSVVVCVATKLLASKSLELAALETVCKDKLATLQMMSNELHSRSIHSASPLNVFLSDLVYQVQGGDSLTIMVVGKVRNKSLTSIRSLRFVGSVLDRAVGTVTTQSGVSDIVAPNEEVCVTAKIHVKFRTCKTTHDELGMFAVFVNVLISVMWKGVSDTETPSFGTMCGVCVVTAEELFNSAKHSNNLPRFVLQQRLRHTAIRRRQWMPTLVGLAFIHDASEFVTEHALDFIVKPVPVRNTLKIFSCLTRTQITLSLQPTGHCHSDSILGDRWARMTSLLTVWFPDLTIVSTTSSTASQWPATLIQKILPEMVINSLAAGTQLQFNAMDTVTSYGCCIVSDPSVCAKLLLMEVSKLCESVGIQCQQLRNRRLGLLAVARAMLREATALSSRILATKSIGTADVVVGPESVLLLCINVEHVAFGVTDNIADLISLRRESDLSWVADDTVICC